MDELVEKCGLDAEVAQAVEAYLEAAARGEQPDRNAFLAAHEELADELRKAFVALDFIGSANVIVDEPTEAVRALGDYRIEREIGRGGMGVVYEAEQLSLGRRVALKVLPFAAVMDPRQLQRFKNEAQAAAHLHHTHIVPVHSVGCERGVHYYAMQYIEGMSLAQMIDQLRGFQDGNGRPAMDPASSSALDAITTERTTDTPEYCRAVARLGVQAAHPPPPATPLATVGSA